MGKVRHECAELILEFDPPEEVQIGAVTFVDHRCAPGTFSAVADEQIHSVALQQRLSLRQQLLHDLRRSRLGGRGCEPLIGVEIGHNVRFDCSKLCCQPELAEPANKVVEDRPNDEPRNLPVECKDAFASFHFELPKLAKGRRDCALHLLVAIVQGLLLLSRQGRELSPRERLTVFAERCA